MPLVVRHQVDQVLVVDGFLAVRQFGERAIRNVEIRRRKLIAERVRGGSAARGVLSACPAPCDCSGTPTEAGVMISYVSGFESTPCW